MKKHLFFFVMAVMLILPAGLNAQQTLTINHGTWRDRHAPFYSYNLGGYNLTEFVLPADSLTAMNDSLITSMSFQISWPSDTENANWEVSFRVYVKEVPYTTISAFEGDSTSTVVYYGQLSATNGVMKVTFIEPYHYQGGNLLIGFQNLTTKTGNGNYPDYWWAGTTAPVNTVLWDVKLNDNETFTPVAVNPAILPLTTFEYRNKTFSTVIDFETNDFSQHTFTTINEPWVVVTADNGSGYCMKNSNSNSGGNRARTRAAYNYIVDGYVIFDAKCLGSTSSSFNYDVCTFYIDWGTQFKYGSQVEGWHTYMFPVSAGDHTFDWEYYRFSYSPNRGFFVDNIVFGIGTPCVTPHNFKVRSTSIDTVTLSWLGYSDNYTIRYRTIGGSAWTTLTGITGDNYNLGGIPQGDYEVQISADCEPDNWVAATFSIENIQSTANCYGYVGYNYSGTVGAYSFISFPVQQPSSITAATGTIHSSSYSMYTYTAAYANGYVWCINRDGDLTIARLDNTHKTISDFETIVSGFESKSINTMSYNPADGLIYYITADSILKCFNPFQPNQITEIGTFNKEILAFAINSLGEAYGVEIESGDLYRINLNDASTMLVGPTGVACELSQGMAFDLQTNELFWAQYYSNLSNGLYKVNTNTGYATYLGKIGQIRAELMGMFVGDDNQPNCEIPLNFTVSNVSYYNATLSWDGNASATEWAIEYDTTASFTAPTTINSSTNQKELTGLTPKTLYYVRLKAICGANGGSPWVTRQFTTPLTCPAPDYVAGSDFQPRSFTVNWNPGHAIEWTFEYDTTANFTTATSVTVTVPYYQATGLTPATTYHIRIKANCGGGDESDWTVKQLTLPIACAAPTNLSVSNISDTSAVLSWNATTASEYVISVNGTELAPIAGTTYTLNGLTAGTSCEVKVRGNCGSDGYSDWSSSVTFVSAFCSSDNQCEIRYKFNDSYGDGWQGCGINVVDVATNVVISTLTLPSGSNTTGALPLCNGRDIRFEWVSGSYPDETSYTFFTTSGDTIFSGSDALGSPVTYTMSCPACSTPSDLTIIRNGSDEVTLTWSGNSHASGWVVEYGTAADFTGATTVNATTNSTTLAGLTPDIPYYVHVKADCGVDGESDWSETANFVTILSTDIWYSYASNTSSGQSWKNRFIRFNMQSPEVVEQANSLKFPDSYAATYANGYVWFIKADNGDLWRAPLNNHDIGTYETVVTGIENETVGAMSYNPTDGKIYYMLWSSHVIKCFDPAQPDIIITIDTADKNYRTFAINGSGEAFGIDNQGDLYRISLTDASTTLVGSTGIQANYVQSMAFDHNTGELFWAQYYYTNISALYWVNPTTAATSLLGHIGGDPNVQATGLFMVPNTTSPTTVVNVGSCSQQAGYVPSANQFTYSLTEQIYTAAEIGESGIINSIAFFNNGSTVTRNYDIYLVHTNKTAFFGDDWVPVTTADLVFSGDVQMASNVWSEISLDVPFDYNGIDNLMILMDDNTGTYLNDLHCSGDIHYENRSLFVCGYNENYNPLTLSNYSSYLDDKTCCLQFKMTPTCQKPHNLNINYNNQHDATLTWDCNATNFNVEYKKTTDATWQSLTTTNHSITLNNLALGDYEVRVKAVCTPGVSESDWGTTTFSITDIQSTANWYTLIASSFDHSEWNSKYITFSMQDVTTGTTASAAMSYTTPIATYADGYVWTVDNDPNTNIQCLFRAPLDNNTQTIGALQTVTNGFENGNVNCLSYNPTDGRIYYVLNNKTIKSFHPSSPDATTVVCTVSGIYIRTIAFNSQGKAYFIDDIYRRLYRLNMADASYTLVGDLPNAVFMDFDHTTDELFCSCYDNGYHIGLVDTATAAMHDLGYVGGDDYVIAIGLFMASGSTNPCFAPANLNVSSIGMNGATLQWNASSNSDGWVVEYATASDFSDATTVTVTTNSYSLTGLTAGTLYYVRVKTHCSTNDESSWSNISFQTGFCPASDQCNITYELGNSFGDGWNGCAINVVDVATGSIIGTLTMDNGTTFSGTLPVCDGRDIRFEWANGLYADETSYTVYDAEGNVIFSGSNILTTPVIYTVNCQAVSNLISIGNCTSGSENLPSYSYYNYCLSQQIYTAAEIGRAGAISSVSFYNDGDTKTRNYDMYLVHTNKSAFSDDEDWVPVTAGDLVFSGSVEMKSGEWTAINLDVPFQYNGTDNLLLVMDDNSGSWSSGMSCYTFSTTDWQALHVHEDYTDYAPFTPDAYQGYTASYKNCIRLDFGAVCPKPKNLTRTITNQNNVTLTWESNATSFNVNYKKTTDTQWQQFTTTTNTVTLSGLDFASYEVRVQAVCDPGILESDWVTTSFALFNLQSTANWYGFVQYSVDNPEWMAKYISFSMQDFSTADTASSHHDIYPGGSTYANGYVWTLYYDNSYTNLDLYRAPLDNGTKTIGHYELVKSGFESTDASSMSYNPNDGQIYYLRSDQTLASFDPEDPDVVTVIGNYSQYLEQIAINGSGEAYCLDYDGNLYRISTTDASVTYVGNIPSAASIAFDSETGELYCAVYTSSGQIICAVDPMNAAIQELGYIGGDSTIAFMHMFMVSGTTNICYAPQALTFSAIGMTQATVSWAANSHAEGWVVEYSTVPDFTGSTIVNVTTNSCTLTGLTSATIYYVRVKADCGTDGESYWTVRSFSTNVCETASQCEISYELEDSWGDGWNGCAINVVDVASNVVVGTLTMTEGSTLSGTMPVCDGREIRFEWVDGYSSIEVSYTVLDPEGNVIFSGSDALSAPVLYTMNCPVPPCPAPTSLAASNITDENATLTWTESGSATEWQICVNGDESNLINVTSNPYTLNGLTPETPYTVKVRANCGTDGTSDWSNVVIFTTEPMVIPPFFYIDGEDSICPSQTTVLTAVTNLGTDYLWSTGETNQSITVSVGNYSVTVSKNGNAVAHDSFEVKAKQSYNITITKTVCESELPYTWNGVTFDAAGTQEVTLTAANGCDSIVTMTLMLKYAEAAEIAETACDSYEWNGQTFTVSGDYDQTFTAVNGCDSIVTLHLTINSSYAVSDTKTVCESELPYTWNGVTFDAAGTQEVTLTAANGCDSVVTMTLMLKYAEIAEIAETACDSYEWNGQTYTTTGDYDQTFTAANGCDSVVTLHLTINSSYAVSDTKTVCESELPYEWNGVTFDAAGTQEVTLTAANGCDSVVTMSLMLKYAKTAEIAETACDSYEWNGQTFTVSGDYDQTFTAANGCDSVVTLHLTINSSYAVTDAKTVCESELPYTWNGVTFNAAGTQEVTLTAANGCDSVVTMILTLKYAETAEIAETACDSYEWNGQTYTVSGDYDQTFTAANGCDSVVTLHLTINSSYAVTDAKTVCESELPYDWNGVTFDAAGTQEVTLTAANGCDSVVTMILMLKYAETAEIAETACNSYEWNGQTYTVSSDYDQTFTAANGCDSVVTLHLTINSSYAVSDTKTVCESELPYEWNGVTFDAAGTQEVTLTAANGCDSIVTMTLMLKYAAAAEIAETACDSFEWNGQTYTASGDYDQTFTAANGCDSIVTLHLTINSSYAVTDTKTVCESELPYTWNDVTFDAAGTQEVTLTAVNGCDSVVTMILMLKYAETAEIAETACNSYEWNGQTYTVSSDYDQTFTAANGCDSVVTLHLTINSSYAVSDTKTVCESELPYEWNGVTFDAAGTQEVTLTAANGCDSVVTMILMLKYAETAEIAETACNSYEWNSQTYTVSGDYDQTFTAANGCDSIVTLHLTINSSYAVTETKTVCESELPYEWNGVTFDAAGTQEVTLTATDGCDSVVTMTLMLKYAEIAEIAETACDSYEWNGQTFTTTGDYDQTFAAVNGCDSVVTLHLTINSSYAVTDTKTVCESELPYEWNGITFDAAGTQEVTLTAVNSCDSVVTMTLMLKYAETAEIAETACDSYEWNGQTYTTTGDYDQTFTAVNGCDSIVTLHLTINSSYAVTDTKTVCESELPYEWNGVTFDAAGTQEVTLTAANGCDSVVTMTLTLKYAAAAEIAETACNSYEWNGQTYTASGDYDHTFTAANGCDSVVTLHLTINSSYAVTDNKTVCASELPYTWNDVVFNAAGTQDVTLQAANGCDSVVTMTLTVNPTYAVTDIRSVCPSELPYTWNGVVFNNASAQSVTLQAANGCDSVVTMILTVNQTHVTTDSRTICQSELPYTWNGVVFNAASVKTATLQDANGCDSTVIMTLTVNPTYNITETQSVCQSELPYTWHGITFNAAGTQVLNLQTVSGCDSVVTLTLAVNPTYAVTDTRSVCPSELPYTWNGVVFNAAGAQSVTLQAANGCDSTVTMILTVNQTHVTTDSRTVCQSELPYSWNGITFSSAGVMTATLQDANGCDSTVIMTLTVNPTYNITETQSVCQSDLPYTWHGITFDAAGTQVLNLQTVSGCDSVITMTLTVNSAVQSDLYETVCDSHEWNGITYTESGDYTQTFPAANGCDSVVILHLTVNQSVSTEATVSCPDSCYIWNGQSYCASGDYTQTLQTVNGCDSTVTLHLTITVGIDEHSLASSMTVYPNPTSGIVNVQCTMTDMQTETVEFHVHDAYGKLVDVVETRFIASGEPATAQIDLSRYANGVYFVKAVANRNVVAVRKVVKR